MTDTTSTDAPSANLPQVKQKALALLTNIYRTETGDVKKMAMSLLTTLYKVENDDEMADIEIKMKRLMSMMNGNSESDTTRAASPPASSEFEIQDQEEQDADEKKEESTSDSSQKADTKMQLKEFSKRPEHDDLGKGQDALLQEAMIQKQRETKWNVWPTASIINFRNNTNNNGQTTAETKAATETSKHTNASKERVDLKTKRENFMKGWRESTSKIQTSWLKAAGVDLGQDDNIQNMKANAAKHPSPASSGSSIVTVGTDLSDSSSSASPGNMSAGSRKSPTVSQRRVVEDKEEEDLLHVIQNFVNESDPKSRAKLEDALSPTTSRKSQWTAAKARWKRHVDFLG